MHLVMVSQRPQPSSKNLSVSVKKWMLGDRLLKEWLFLNRLLPNLLLNHQPMLL